MSKNDPNDARPVAVAALRSSTCLQVSADDHAAVLRMRSRRHQHLGQAVNRTACRLHAVLCDLGSLSFTQHERSCSSISLALATICLTLSVAMMCGQKGLGLLLASG